MVSSNMPGYQPPATSVNAMTNFVTSEEVDTTILCLHTSIDVRGSRGHICLSTVPIVHGCVTESQSMSISPFHGNCVSAFASLLVSYKWCVFGFNSGHFVCTIQTHNIPFEIDLAADCGC